MTADVVNLRRFRKRKDREERAAAAAENRAIHGRSRADRARAAAEKQHADRKLEAHAREHDDGA